MYAVKQAMLLSGALPLADITIYYMDIRAFGKGYEEFYQNSIAMGVEFVKGRCCTTPAAATAGAPSPRSTALCARAVGPVSPPARRRRLSSRDGP
jgi:hypothetical protein